MAKTKHNPNASVEIDNYIAALPAWSKKICQKLRIIALQADKEIIEDWKWGPNYYCKGMVCGMAAHQKFVNFVFFQGALLKDKKKVLKKHEGTLHNRHIRYTDVSQVNEELLLEYLFEAIDNNKAGKKLLVTKSKVISIPADIKKSFSKQGVLKDFEDMNFSRRKEYMYWINSAKREETRTKRITTAIEMIRKKQGVMDKYTKK
ncbi:MAG TPA: YdeI/OmpD-associated family protein [Bacteroidia bacterium]|nr:YdeI/OmpD-associated family protein [Bacteroidia bacterium]